MWPSVTVASSSTTATRTTTTAANSIIGDSSPSSPFDLFSKEGRKIGVGDCALFKPPHDAPPFIGIIRKLTFEKENNISLSVNWLYRPSDIKLAKGALLEAAPNEIFYSFHQDETPAASLLHPCKVVFLRKCVELPSGICSFVCRRVYDIDNERLWWLTDKDYINERQEEVDHLLDKTRLEMNGVVQSGGRSPKSLNGPMSTSQLKPGSDSVQNNTLFSSQVKGKKRERGDQGSDPCKRERLLKTEDGDTGQWVAESVLRSEISKITEKGGLIDFEGVERLVQLMQPSSADKKLDLAGRIMLVDVIAATDRFDCLGRFVQLRGLPVLDEWLQEVHKGKIGDVSSPKESDKSVDEYLFALLRALDKLPVNLHALQTCNVGKSVNNLRSHKNSEIQKKARSLVDTWKKRVEVEMNMTDVKTGRVAWTTKPVPSEVSHAGDRKSVAPSEVKSAIGQPSLSRSSQSKSGAADALARLSQSPGPLKSLAASGNNTKDSTTKTSDLALTPVKEERSSSSSQSQNNSQCCSSDQAKTVGSSYKEDARSSTAGSVSLNKVSAGASRHRKLSNGLHGSLASGVPKEVGSAKISSSNRNSASDKASPSNVSIEKALDTPVSDHGNNQRLIVRLPNTSRNPSRVASGGFEDPSILSSRASPSAEKEDNLDSKVESKDDTLQANTLSNNNLDTCNGKDKPALLEEGNVPDSVDDRGRDGDDGEKCLEGLKASGSTSGLLPSSGKSYDPSYSSINALIESCAKFSETNASAFPEDDVGMNLLASVAAGEIPKSESSSPSGSLLGNSHAPEELRSGNDEKSGHMNEGSQTQRTHDFGANIVHTDRNGTSLGPLQAKNDSNCPATPSATVVRGDSKDKYVGCDEMMRECIAAFSASSINLQRLDDGQHLKPDVKRCEPTLDASAGINSSDTIKEIETESAIKFDERRKPGNPRGRSSTISDSKSTGKTPVLHAVKKVEQAVGETNLKCTVFAATEADLIEKVKNEVLGENRDAANRDSSCGTLTGEKPSIDMENNHLSREAKVEDAVLCSGFGSVLPKECDSCRAVDKNSSLDMEIEKQTMVPVPGPVSGDNNGCTQDELGKGFPGQSSGASALPVDSAGDHVRENGQHQNSSECKLDVEGERKKERLTPGIQTSGSAGSSGMTLKVDFDLNEGFFLEDAVLGEPVKSVISRSSSMSNLSVLPVPIHPVPGSFPTAITVAATAKGPFVLPENPMRSKSEAGWRGSAATSAFRPAEPRKNLDVPVSTNGLPTIGNTAGRQGRAPLDFDLNVADEQDLEDVASQALPPETGSRDSGTGGFKLDLNIVDDGVDVGPLSAGSTSKFELLPGSSRSSLSGGLSNGGKASIGFDLNNGPGLDELGTETAPRSLPVRSNFPFAATVPGVRMNTTEYGNLSSWFPQGCSYSGIGVPSLLPGRREQIVVTAPPAGSSSFGPEMYRGPVLSSSPAVAFSPTTAFQYQGFPFETSFPLLSTSFPGNSAAYLESSSGNALCFPTNPSQLVGAAGGPFPRPYIMSLPTSTGHVGAENRNWGSLPLDLNAGPSGTDTERRDQRLPAGLRQMSVPSSLALTEEQMKMYQATNGVFKRKEPDGGWDGADRFGYKHAPWQ